MPHSLLAIHLQYVLASSANIRIPISARKLTILDIEGKNKLVGAIERMKGEHADDVPYRKPAL